MLFHLIRALRPGQWFKNGVIFLPLLSSPRFSAEGMTAAGLLFGIWCLLSGSVYLFNDFIDCDRDRMHPVKRHRAVAAGKVSHTQAVVMIGACIAAGLTPGAVICLPLLPLLLAYLGYAALYTLFLKKIILVDVIIIVIGFIIRLLSAYTLHALPPSPWMVALVTVCAFFFITGKRRAEMNRPMAYVTRPVLLYYDDRTLDRVLVVLSMMIIAVYALAPVASGIPRMHPACVVFSWPAVLFGLRRYMRFVRERCDGEDCLRIVYTDRPLRACLLLWGLIVAGMEIWIDK